MFRKVSWIYFSVLLSSAIADKKELAKVGHWCWNVRSIRSWLPTSWIQDFTSKGLILHDGSLPFGIIMDGLDWNKSFLVWKFCFLTSKLPQSKTDDKNILLPQPSCFSLMLESPVTHDRYIVGHWGDESFWTFCTKWFCSRGPQSVTEQTTLTADQLSRWTLNSCDLLHAQSIFWKLCHFQFGQFCLRGAVPNLWLQFRNKRRKTAD